MHVIRIDAKLIDSTVRYDFGYCRWWGIGDASDTVIIISVVIVVIFVVAAVVVVRFHFSCSGGLPFAMHAFRVHLTRLFDKSLRHRPQMIALGYHDVRQFATLCGHSNLCSNIVFVNRMHETKWMDKKLAFVCFWWNLVEEWLTVVKTVMAR